MNPADEIAISIGVGLDVESDDPSMKDVLPDLTPEQIRWLGAWLAGEGFHR